MNQFGKTGCRGRAALCFVAVFAAFDLAAGEDADSPNVIRQTRSIALLESPDAVAISGDGKTIAVSCGPVLTAIEVIGGKELHRWEQPANIIDISLSKDGQLVAVTTGSPLIDVYERGPGNRSRQLHRADAPDFLRNDGQQRLAFYPDGAKLVSSGTRSRIYVSDVETGDWDHIMFVKYDASTPVVAPDGNHVALCGMKKDSELSGHVTMFRVRRGLQPLWTKWHSGEKAVSHAAFSPNGARLATCGAGDGVRVWDVESGELLAHVEDDTGSRLLGVSFVGDGNHLLTASPRRLQLWKTDGKKPLASVEIAEQESLAGIACSDDGAVAVTCAGEAAVDVWSVQQP